MTKGIFYAGYGDMWQRVLEMAARLPEIDAIAGVPVSGLASAGMLSAATGIKCVPLEAIPNGVRRLLVLEDASGFAKCKTARMGQAPGREVFYGAVYACDRAVDDLDVVGCIAEKSRIFTWNLTKSCRSPFFAYDLDGVLCRNPQPDEIDYGPRYQAFLRDATPLRVARTQLGWIVTGRMERYRAETVAWLAKYRVQYGALIMAGDDQQHTLEAHAQHKARWYCASDALLFVESHPRQAQRIAELTGKPVVCAETEEAWNTRPAKSLPARVSKAKNTRLIYTVSTGQYEAHAPRSVTPPPGWDYRVVTSADCPNYLTPKQQAAWAKIHGPRLFADYEASLCIDDDMTVTADPEPLFADRAVCLLARSTVPTWKQDLDIACRIRKACTLDQVNAEIARLQAAGFSDSRVYLTGVVWRRHTPDIQRLCDEWAYYYAQSETQRDQPSLAIACQALRMELPTITEKDAEPWIRHDIRKADRDGTRYRIGTAPEPLQTQKPRRRGDRL